MFNNFDEGNPPVVQGVGSYPPPMVTSGQHQQQKQNNKGGNPPVNGIPQPQSQQQTNRDFGQVFQHVFQTYAIDGQPYWLPSTVYSYGNGNPVNAYVTPIDQGRIAGYCVRWPDGSFHIIRPDHPMYAQIEKDSTDLTLWIERAKAALKAQKDTSKKRPNKQAVSDGTITVLTRVPLWAILWFIALTAASVVLFIR